MSKHRESGIAFERAAVVLRLIRDLPLDQYTVTSLQIVSACLTIGAGLYTREQWLEGAAVSWDAALLMDKARRQL